MQLAILWCCINYLLEKCRFFCCSRKAVSSAVAGLTPLDASTTHAVSRARIGRAACVSWTFTRLLPTERSYRMHGVHTVVPRVRVGTNCPSICFPRTFDSIWFHASLLWAEHPTEGKPSLLQKIDYTLCLDKRPSCSRKKLQARIPIHPAEPDAPRNSWLSSRETILGEWLF